MMTPTQLFRDANSSPAVGGKHARNPADGRKRYNDSSYIVQDGRAARSQTSEQIRKEKKHLRLALRRNKNISPQVYSGTQNLLISMTEKVEACNASVEESNHMSFLQHVFQLRKIVTGSESPDTLRVAQSSGALVMFLKALDVGMALKIPDITYEGTFGISHLARFDQVEVAHYCLQKMTTVFSQETHAKVQSNCVLFFGNLGVKNQGLRMSMLKSTLVRQALERFVLGHGFKSESLHNSLWTLRSIAKGCSTVDERVALEWSKTFTPLLSKIIQAKLTHTPSLQDSEDRDILENAFGALAGLLSSKWLGDFLPSGSTLCCETLAVCVASQESGVPSRVLIPILLQVITCLDQVANNGSASEISTMLESGFLETIPPLLAIESKVLRKELGLVFSNVVAYSHLVCRISLQQRMDLLRAFAFRLDVEEEMSLIVGKLLSHDDEHTMSIIATMDEALHSLRAGLDRPDNSLRKLILEGILNLMKFRNGFAIEYLQAAGVIESIHKIRSDAMDPTLSELVDHVLDADLIKSESLDEPGLSEEDDFDSVYCLEHSDL